VYKQHAAHVHECAVQLGTWSWEPGVQDILNHMGTHQDNRVDNKKAGPTGHQMIPRDVREQVLI